MNLISIIKRRGTKGSCLPYDAELSYIKGTNKTWIDTGVLANTTNMEISADFTTDSGYNENSSQGLFGNMDINSYTNDLIGWRFTQLEGLHNGGRWAIASPHRFYTSYVPAFTIDTRYIVVAGPNGKAKLKEYGKETWIVNTTVSIPQGTILQNNLLLFTDGEFRITNNTLAAQCQLKLHSLSIKKNGILVKDYIPVRVGSIGYLYDKVSKSLVASDGPGNFILGPDK